MIKAQRDNEEEEGPADSPLKRVKSQTNNCVLPKAVDDVLSFPKVDFIQCGANLVLHVLKAQ